MPEYLSPGVYVEESDAGAHRIPGVSTSIDAACLQLLVAEVRKAVASHCPTWTDSNASDPGVALLELLAWLTEILLYRADQIPARGRAAAVRAASALSSMGHFRTPACTTLTRPRFYTGRLLDAATLQAEQDYHREKLRRHNRRLHGFGVVSGLGVHVETSSGGDRGRIVVDPGCAIDGYGEEIAVCSSATLTTPDGGNEAFVSVRFWEHSRGQDAPWESGGPGGASIEEACVISVGPAVLPPALALAHLIRMEGAWCVDPTFAPPRAGSVTA